MLPSGDLPTDGSWSTAPSVRLLQLLSWSSHSAKRLKPGVSNQLNAGLRSWSAASQLSARKPHLLQTRPLAWARTSPGRSCSGSVYPKGREIYTSYKLSHCSARASELNPRVSPYNVIPFGRGHQHKLSAAASPPLQSPGTDIFF